MFSNTIRTLAARWLTAHALLASLLCAGTLQAAQAQAQAPQLSASVSAPVLLASTDSKSIQRIPALASYLDASGKLTVDQIEQSGTPFLPLDPNKAQLIGDGALWLRFDVTTSGTEAHGRLTLPLPTVDSATLYYRNVAGQWVKQLGGDSVPMSQWAQAGRYPAFSMSQGTDQAVRYYLKIAHTRVPFSVWPRMVRDTELIVSRQNEHTLLGMYFALVGLMALLALVYATAYRDWGFATYAIYATMVGASLSAVTGMMALYWWPESPQLNNGAAMLAHSCMAGAGLWFVRTVTSPRRFSRTLDWTMLVLGIAMPLIGLANALVQQSTSFAIYNVALGACLLVVLLAVAVAIFEGDRNARWLVLGFLPIVLTSIAPLLRNFDVINTDFSTEYGRMLGSVIELPILFYGLTRRVAQRRDPAARATGLRSTDPLTGLYSSGKLTHKLKQVLYTSARYHQPFALLVIDLTNLSALQKKYNREVADRAMVMAAARLRGLAHSDNTVARVGDAQFALLIEGPVSADDANDVATKILAAGLRATNQLPEREPLQFHIVLGYRGDFERLNLAAADTLLAQLMTALKEMRDDSRKAIRVLPI